ncbi:hypothetical protein V5O48_009622 [Marasmius crinis-equi]|uniref:Uncharacterized protein n=1 Tax=Marasmius crinis-equi TaxID=585013 RepID=A0ABR3FBC5_9AGAR
MYRRSAVTYDLNPEARKRSLSPATSEEERRRNVRSRYRSASSGEEPDSEESDEGDSKMDVDDDDSDGEGGQLRVGTEKIDGISRTMQEISLDFLTKLNKIAGDVCSSPLGIEYLRAQNKGRCGGSDAPLPEEFAQRVNQTVEEACAAGTILAKEMDERDERWRAAEMMRRRSAGDIDDAHRFFGREGVGRSQY